MVYIHAKAETDAGFASFFGLAALTEGAVGYMDSGTPVFGPTSPAFFRRGRSGSDGPPSRTFRHPGRPRSPARIRRRTTTRSRGR